MRPWSTTARRRWPPWPTLVAVALALSVAGCGAGGPAAGDRSVTVFAAASLTEAVTALAEQFEAGHPGTSVLLSFAGSASLVAQLQQGAAADLVVTADERTMAALQDRLDGEPQLLARNALAVVVEPGNPLGVRRLADLTRSDVSVVLGGRSVPVGRAARDVLERDGLRVRPVSEEPDVKAVLAKVRLGEADAGVVYATDLRAAGADVDGFVLEGPGVGYPAAVLADASSPQAARELVETALSPAGQQLLARFGFLPP